MFKKILAIFAASAIVFAGVPAAQAAGNLTQTEKIVFGDTLENTSMKLVRVSDTLTVALWTEVTVGGRFLKSAVVSADGQLGEPSQFGTSSANETFSNLKFAVSPDHLLTVAFRHTIDGGGGDQVSSIQVAFTDDGVNWSAPITALPGVMHSFCDPFMDFGCGYEVQGLVYDHLSHLVLLATLSDENRSTSILATSSSDGVQWANATTLQTGDDTMSWTEQFGSSCIKLSATGAGALASWCSVNSGNSSTRLWSAVMPDSAHPFWLNPVNDYNSAPGIYVYNSNLFRTSNGGLFETLWEMVDNHPTLKTRTWSPTTRTWSGATVIYTASSEYIHAGKDTATVANLSVISWAEVTNGTDDSIHSLVFNDGVAGTPATLRSGAGDGTSNLDIFGLSVSLDQTVTLAFWNYTLPAAILLEQTPGSPTVTTTIPTDLSYNYATKIAEDAKGNLTLLTFWMPAQGSGNDLVLFQKARASAPVTSAKPAIVGKAKVKAKLTASSVAFTSVSGASAAAYQWYSCTKAVKKAPTTAPKTCKAIKGATKAQYVVNKADAKKYLMVTTSSSNTVGKKTVFSASTAVVK